MWICSEWVFWARLWSGHAKPRRGVLGPLVQRAVSDINTPCEHGDSLFACSS